MTHNELLSLAERLVRNEISADQFLRDAVPQSVGSEQDYTLDVDRAARCGFPEVIYGEGKTVDAIARHLKVWLPKCQTAATPLLRAEESEGVSGILPPPVTSDAVEHYCHQEWARHLEDVMVRRTSWRYYHRNHLELARQVADWMGQHLGWDDQRTHSEFEEYRRSTTSAERPDSA